MALFLSQGTPVLTMGDEYGHSKGGSTSADDRCVTASKSWNFILQSSMCCNNSRLTHQNVFCHVSSCAFDWDALQADFGEQMTYLISSLLAFRARRNDVFQVQFVSLRLFGFRKVASAV